MTAHERAISISTLAITAGVVFMSPARAEASFDCVTEPNLKLKIAAPVAGVLKVVAVDRGSAITQGQLLAKLDSGVEEASLALDEARARLDATITGRRARLDFLVRKRARLVSLESKGAATPTAVDEVATDLQMATGDLREAEKNKELARLEADKQREIVNQRSVFSPIDGVVVERSLYAGEYAYEQAPIMTVAQVNPLKVEVYLPTALYRSVRKGVTVSVEPEAPFAEKDTAVVDVIDSLIDTRSGTFGVRLTLPNPGNKLPPGTRCRVTFP